MDEALIAALSNIPFAAVLIYWIKLDFQQRRKNLTMMTDMVQMFTAAMKECCQSKDDPETFQGGTTNVS